MPATSSPVEESAFEDLVSRAASLTGFAREAIVEAKIRALMQNFLVGGATASQLLAKLEQGEPRLVTAIIEAVSVEETYFFRHPDHFSFLASEVARFDSAGPLRAWSAGCATGEEAWSLAACLKSEAPGREIEVLGTDMIERHLRTARAGVYRGWSVRPSGPMLYPATRTDKDAVRVLDALRPSTRFEQHNLLDPPPPGRFDVIFCRNVLVYFTAESADRVLANLTSALAPRGLLMFGIMDVGTAPSGLRRKGAITLNAFSLGSTPTPPASRPMNRPRRIPSPSPSPSPSRPDPIEPPAREEPIALHAEALWLIEQRRHSAAAEVLSRLVALAPDYLPYLLEQALLERRRGDLSQAASLMRDLIRRTDGLPPEQIIAGPADLPVAYYRASAMALLAFQEGR